MKQVGYSSSQRQQCEAGGRKLFDGDVRGGWCPSCPLLCAGDVVSFESPLCSSCLPAARVAAQMWCMGVGGGEWIAWSQYPGSQAFPVSSLTEFRGQLPPLCALLFSCASRILLADITAPGAHSWQALPTPPTPANLSAPKDSKDSRREVGRQRRPGREQEGNGAILASLPHQAAGNLH